MDGSHLLLSLALNSLDVLGVHGLSLSSLGSKLDSSLLGALGCQVFLHGHTLDLFLPLAGLTRVASVLARGSLFLVLSGLSLFVLLGLSVIFSGRSGVSIDAVSSHVASFSALVARLGWPLVFPRGPSVSICAVTRKMAFLTALVACFGRPVVLSGVGIGAVPREMTLITASVAGFRLSFSFRSGLTFWQILSLIFALLLRICGPLDLVLDSLVSVFEPLDLSPASASSAVLIVRVVLLPGLTSELVTFTVVAIVTIIVRLLLTVGSGISARVLTLIVVVLVLGSELLT
jgi:hypothetical protein